MSDREDAFEVAKLAAMVGGQLKKVDQMTTERRSVPANRINIHDFINAVKNPNAPLPVNLPPVPAGFAAPLSENYVQSMVPDIQPSFTPPPNAETKPLTEIPTSLPTAVASANSFESGKAPVLPSITNKLIDDKIILNRSDVDSIRNSLKNIDKALNNMLNLFKNSKAFSQWVMS